MTTLIGYLWVPFLLAGIITLAFFIHAVYGLILYSAYQAILEWEREVKS